MQIAIVGAGAAGCFAAANIPRQPGTVVTIYEKTGKALQKVKVSGGGRCNTTHYLFDVLELSRKYPRGARLLRKTLHHFGPQQTIDWFGEKGILLKHEADGRMFPETDNSQTIIDGIWQEMMRRNVMVKYHKSIERIERKEPGFVLHFADKTEVTCDKLLIACGGFPKEEQYHWLQSLGHTVQPPAPSLFTFNLKQHPVTQLMGVSVPMATVRIAGTRIAEEGPVLITHWGLSGPAVLRTSAWGARELQKTGYHFHAIVNWLHDATEEDVKQTIKQQRQDHGKQLVFQKNPFALPRRLWEFLLLQAGVQETVKWGELGAAAQNKLTTCLVRHSFEVSGKTTFKEEFVTCGGITLAEINPATMESRIVPGLYFAGEIMDVDGITGGFNFQHAWSSGYIAAQSITQG